MNDTGELRVAAASLQWDGIGRDGSEARLGKTLAVLDRWRPHVVLVQELTGLPPAPLDGAKWALPAAARNLRFENAVMEADAAATAHLARIARETDMSSVFGPPGPMQFRRMHTAILVREAEGIEITGTGPPAMAQPGVDGPAWCQAMLAVPGIPYEVDVYSVRLPAGSAAEQLRQAQWLANVIAWRGRLAHAAGDWNSIPRSGQPSEDTLRAMNPHLRPARMILDGGPLRPDYSVDDTLTGTGLTDIAVSLPPERRDPAELTPAGRAGSRVDRHYATEELAAAAVGYRKLATGGSGHDMSMVIYDRAVLASAVPPGSGD